MSATKPSKHLQFRVRSSKIVVPCSAQQFAASVRRNPRTQICSFPRMRSRASLSVLVVSIAEPPRIRSAIASPLPFTAVPSYLNFLEPAYDATFSLF